MFFLVAFRRSDFRSSDLFPFKTATAFLAT
jgi:hypothetical protein